MERVGLDWVVYPWVNCTEARTHQSGARPSEVSLPSGATTTGTSPGLQQCCRRCLLPRHAAHDSQIYAQVFLVPPDASPGLRSLRLPRAEASSPAIRIVVFLTSSSQEVRPMVLFIVFFCILQLS
jgi:hypothetical protein